MLAMRQRGKTEIWYIRGTVKYGKESILVPEFSTGTSDEHVAAFLKGEHERKLIERLIFGPAASVSQASIADAFEAYLTKPVTPALSRGAVWGAGAEQELPAAVRAAGWSPVRGCPEYLPWQAVERVEATGFVRRGRRGRRVK